MKNLLSIILALSLSAFAAESGSAKDNQNDEMTEDKMKDNKDKMKDQKGTMKDKKDKMKDKKDMMKGQEDMTETEQEDMME